MPLLASAAVMLCVAMVLVVWSVMGGFLRTLLDSGKTIIGDVSITWPVQGIPRYERLIDMLEADPLVARATPVVESIGLLTLPSTDTRHVQVIGVDPEGYSEVTGFAERLWWKPLAEPMPRDTEQQDPRLDDPRMAQWENDGLTLRERDPETDQHVPAVVLGIEISGYNNARTRAGFFDPVHYFMTDRSVTLSVPPISARGAMIDLATRRFPVANEFSTGFHDADANWVIMPIGELQKMLRLDEARRVVTPRGSAHSGVVTNPDGSESFDAPPAVEVVPARATSILVKAAPDIDAAALETRCKEIYVAFEQDMSGVIRVPPSADIPIFTWENKPSLARFVSAVKKETSLVLVLFSFISMTAVFLVFAIFWSMISEKTKDIGVLRALGASRPGIAWLFVRYGLAIGVVGAGLGLALAYTVVLNINPIHEWLGETLGIYVWDPQIYLFTTIPNRVEPWKAAAVAGSGVLSSALGALIPAVRAAWMDPVRALRFE